MRFLLVLVFAAAWMPQAFALNTTTELSANYSVAQTLVNVSANLSFEVLVPGLQYERQVLVEWALESEALADVQEDALTIHVFIFSDADSWISFRDGNQSYRALAFDLVCRLENHACANGSTLARNVTAVIAVPENANASHAERVRVQASLSQNYSSVPAEQSQLDEVAEQIQQAVGALPVDVVIQGVQNLASSATNAVAPSTRPTALAEPVVESVDGGNVSATAQPLPNTPVQTASVKTAQNQGVSEQAQAWASTVSGLLAAHPQESGMGLLAVLLMAGVAVWRSRRQKGPRGIFEA